MIIIVYLFYQVISLVNNMYDFKMTQLRMFISIIDEGGFHAAAEKLHKSQPAVSLAIKALENNVGQTLFEKHNHAKPTEFGQAFYSHAKALIAHHDDIQNRLSQLSGDSDLSVRIAVLPSVAQHLMPDLLKSFLQHYPTANIHLRDTSSSRIQELIKARDIDIGLCTIHDISTDFSVKPITQDPFGVVCHHQHPITRLSSIDWEIVTTYQPIANGTWVVLPPTLRYALSSASQVTVINMSSLNGVLKSQLGITVLPELAFAHSADLVFIPLQQPTIYRQIGVIKDNHYLLSAMAKRFYQHIVNPKE